MADCSGATTIQRVCSSLGDQAVGALCRPSPRHELVDTRGRPQVDKLGEHVGQIGLRVDTVELAGLNERSNTGPVLRALVVTGEEGIFSVEHNRTDASFDDVGMSSMRPWSRNRASPSQWFKA